MEPVEIKWTPNELVEYVSNLSAYVAQTLSLDGSVAFDINTLTEDNKATFLNEEINEAVNQLVPHFSRIISDDKDIINTTDGVGFEITPRIEGGSYSKAELSHIKTLSRKLVASYILADWYTVKGIVAMSNYFTTQYAQAGVELDRVLDRFIRPVRRAGVSINRVTYSTKPSQNLVHINNKSDFVLVWSSKDGSALPNGEFDIDFFTDGDVVYSVNSLDAQYVKPIEGENGKVRIIFDFSREGASYFANGVLKYNMYGEATDSDFPDGKRHYEISGETNIEIWSGASDTDGDMFASYVPLYAKLTFEDLTEEDIAVLQTPALEAANTANAGAHYANAMAQFASAQGNAASNAAIEANSAVADARDAIEEVEKTNDTIKTAESERIKQWDNLSESINNAIDSAYQNSSAANAAAKKAEKAYEDVTDLADEITEAEKLREQNTTAAIEAANTAAENTNEATANANTAAERANEIADGIQDDLAKKADIDKSYPKMTAGFAQEIVGDGSATPEEFSFRPTAGEDRNVANTTYYDGERNGVARIEKIKGNSVGWNQLLGIISISNIPEGITATLNEDGSVTINGTVTEKSFFAYNAPFRILRGHKYLITSSNNANNTYLQVPSKKTANFIEGFVTAKEDEDVNYSRQILSAGATFNNEVIRPRIYDLTQMFGAGNEPTTVEEFYQRLPKGIDISEYNKGTIIDGNYGGIKTVGFNAFNGTYAKVCAGCSYYLGGNYTSLGFTTEEGGTLEAIALPTSTESIGTTPSDRLYTPTQNGYIYAEGESININISWGTEYGYLNGTYQPYKPFERDLSWVSKYFPNGMRSAGSARDEIRFNSTTQKWEAVQKVGVVDLGSLKWTYSISHNYFYTTFVGTKRVMTSPYGDYVNAINSIGYKNTANEMLVANDKEIAVNYRSEANNSILIKDTSYTDATTFKTAMSGVMLNYELAEPIVTEIEEIPNMDFDVSDYGTEELIVAEGVQSAPLVADITYTPNALNTLKQVPDILKRLKALESAVASATATTNEETVE